MRNVQKLFVTMLDRIQIRLSRARPGSVLILVVVLVVLLALLGTASLSTTQADRYIATQNMANTQVDLILQAGIEMARSAILGDLYGGVGPALSFRPAEGTGSLSTDYDDFDAYDLTKPPAAPPAQNDIWLSPRFPSAFTSAPNQPWVMWSNLGRVHGVSTFAPSMPGAPKFESPFTMKLRAGMGNLGLSLTDLSIPLVYSDRVSYTNPGFDVVRLTPNLCLPYGVADGRSFPAFLVTDPLGTPGGRYVVAGDADGDGEADSGLYKFPIGEVDGITYYVATRIIDNNSAININTAWSQTSDFDFVPGATPGTRDALNTPGATGIAQNLGIFPSHVGLVELMNNPNPANMMLPASQAEMYAVNLHRSNNQAPMAQAFDDDSASPRADFNWNTQGEAYAFQLARRLNNPGNVVGGAGLTARYKAFEMGDSAALAYRFTLQNREVSPSILEDRLLNAPLTTRDAVYRSAGNDDTRISSQAIFGPNRQYYLATTAGIAAWFDDNFFFESGPRPATIPIPPSNALLPNPPPVKRSIRAMLTTHNPVSNQIRMRLNTGSATLPTNLAIGQTYPLPADTIARRLYSGPTGMGTAQFSGMAPYGGVTNDLKPVKTNVNTASFEELWRAYWCVMMDQNATGTPFTGVGSTYDGTDFNKDGYTGGFVSIGGNNPQRMFRSSLRDPTTAGGKVFAPKDMVLLRSAIAAVQTMQMRGQDGLDPAAPLEQPVLYERIEGLEIQGIGKVRVTIFGTTPQPFITEVVAWRDTKSKGPIGGEPNNTVPYVALELYNPYPFPITLTDDYRIAMVDRTAPYATPGTPFDVDNPTNELHQFANTVIQANGYLLIDNEPDMEWVPPSMDRGPIANTANHIKVAGLHKVLGHGTGGLGGELVIYQRIPDEDNPVSAGGKPLLKAIDSFDFHYFLGSAGGKMGSWHYARPCGGEEDRWKCVYPGRYRVVPTGSGGREERHQGTDWRVWDPDDNRGTAVNLDPGYDAPFLPSLGRASNFDSSYRATITAALPIQLNNLDFGGPNKKIQNAGNKYPFGGFMRNGDILQVPYIAAYTITTHTSNADQGTLVDMNSVSMDAAFAEDSDPQDDGVYPDIGGAREQVGRFCPLRIGTGTAIDDYDPAANINLQRYAWARDLFDYLTVNTPSKDYLPQYPMQREWINLYGAQRQFYKGNLYSVFDLTSGAHIIYRCEATGLYAAHETPEAAGNDLVAAGTFSKVIFNAPSVKNGSAAASTGGSGPTAEIENTVGIEGLININTAPWRVIAAIPWMPAATDRVGFNESTKAFTVGGNSRDDNEDIARAIVYWRDGNAFHNVPPQGPFRSLFDLYRVRIPVDDPAGTYVFEAVQEALMQTGEPDDAQGDFSPRQGNPVATDTKDFSRHDFEEQFLLLTKVSNLLTTRSDTFTVYIQVQGWRGVGTLKPELVVQRRAAFFQDRSKVTAKSSSSAVSVTPVPND